MWRVGLATRGAMRTSRPTSVRKAGPAVLSALFGFSVLLFAAAIATAAESEFRGRIVCLPEEMHRVHKTDLPARHQHIYGLRGEDGSYYTLLRTKLSEALFMDDRLREKDLLLKGKVLPKSQILDVTNIKSIRNGVVHDLYYYCDICAIESVSPAECACCQGPVELIEKPLSGGP